MMNLEYGIKIWCCEEEELRSVLHKCSESNIRYESGVHALTYHLYAPVGLYIQNGALRMEWNKERFDALCIDRVSAKEFVNESEN